MDSQTNGFASCPIRRETILGRKETKGKFSLLDSTQIKLGLSKSYLRS